MRTERESFSESDMSSASNILVFSVFAIISGLVVFTVICAKIANLPL